MAYSKTNWQDLPSTNTPITATRLNNIESGIEINDKTLNGGIMAGDVVVESIRGKNLLDLKTLVNGSVSASDGTYSYYNYSIVSEYIKVQANTTYTIKLNNITSNQFIFRVCLYTTSKVFNTSIMSGTKYTEYSFTPTIDGYVRICFGRGTGSNYNNLTPIYIVETNPQLEIGSSATEYMPYKKLDATNINIQTISNTSGDTGIRIYFTHQLQQFFIFGKSYKNSQDRFWQYHMGLNNGGISGGTITYKDISSTLSVAPTLNNTDKYINFECGSYTRVLIASTDDFNVIII